MPRLTAIVKMTRALDYLSGLCLTDGFGGFFSGNGNQSLGGVSRGVNRKEHQPGPKRQAADLELIHG